MSVREIVLHGQHSPRTVASAHASPVSGWISDPVLEQTQWQSEASCAGENPETMFPEPGDVDGVIVAKLVCSDCPVRAQCLSWAMTNFQSTGVWGGKSESERRAYRRQLQRQAQAARQLAESPAEAPYEAPERVLVSA